MFGTTYALLWAVVLFQAFIIVVLARQMVLLRSHSPAAPPPARSPLLLESEAPRFEAMDLRSGEAVDSSTLRGRRTVLCFVSADCHACRKLAGELSSFGDHSLEGMVLYCAAPQDACRRLLGAIPREVLLLRQKDDDVVSLFQISGFPTAVSLDENARVLAIRTATSVSDLLRDLREPHQHRIVDEQKLHPETA